MSSDLSIGKVTKKLHEEMKIRVGQFHTGLYQVPVSTNNFQIGNLLNGQVRPESSQTASSL